jgi:hypothetical protein
VYAVQFLATKTEGPECEGKQVIEFCRAHVMRGCIIHIDKALCGHEQGGHLPPLSLFGEYENWKQRESIWKFDIKY